MKRDLLIGIVTALLLHGGLALAGNFFKPTPPPPAPVEETIPVIELTPLPPLEPDPVEYSAEASGEPARDLSDIVPPMQADIPSPTASTFVQPIQPPPPPGIQHRSGVTVIPLNTGPGIAGGTGTGFQNLFDLASLDQQPVPRVQIKPVYPYEMSRAGINGEVVVVFVVDPEGNVRNPSIESSSHREFEAEALRAVSRWKFKPGRKNGANVGTRMRMPFIFNLSGN